uniref:(northern house mosquito) hypothetical protein n=1 Tax=Culex pipiens TaxID=7175 RepID=A0A8D8FGM1_CULPI
MGQLAGECRTIVSRRLQPDLDRSEEDRVPARSGARPCHAARLLGRHVPGLDRAGQLRRIEPVVSEKVRQLYDQPAVPPHRQRVRNQHLPSVLEEPLDRSDRQIHRRSAPGCDQRFASLPPPRLPPAETARSGSSLSEPKRRLRSPVHYRLEEDGRHRAVPVLAGLSTED